MSDSFEGDLIRPLGLVTLNFAYAEYELDRLLEDLSPLPYKNREWAWHVGRKLSRAQRLIRALASIDLASLQETLNEVRSLLERRNTLVHSCIFSGGRVVSGRPGVPDSRTSVEELQQLAQAILTCKEQINAARQRVLRPLVVARS